MQLDLFSNINGREKEIIFSSERIINRSISIVKKEKIYNNDYEISYDLYCKAVGRNHFGKAALENFMANIYLLQPLMDPEIKKIKFNINNITCHDLIAYIYIRFSRDLIFFPFQGKRILNLESIKKAEMLNNNYKPYKKKLNYNKNFFIDNKRLSPINSKIEKENINDYLEKLFKSAKYINIIKKLYDKKIYNWANKYSYNNNYFPLRHHYALLAIAVTLCNMSLNDRYLKKFENYYKKLNSIELNCIKLLSNIY